MPTPRGDRAGRRYRRPARHPIGRPLELPIDPIALETTMTSTSPVPGPRPAPLNRRWRHSSFSSGSESTCVDVAVRDELVEVRDSKDPHGPTLSFTFAEWRVFLLGVRAGEFELPTVPTAAAPVARR